MIFTTATEWRTALQRAGHACPRDYSLILLDRHRDRGSADYAGIDQRHPDIGAIAVNHVTDFLTRGEFGLPRLETVTMVEGTLVAGATLRPPVDKK